MLLTDKLNGQKVEVSARANWKPLPDCTAYEGSILLTYKIRWTEGQQPRTNSTIQCSKEDMNCNIRQAMENAS